MTNTYDLGLLRIATVEGLRLAEADPAVDTSSAASLIIDGMFHCLDLAAGDGASSARQEWGIRSQEDVEYIRHVLGRLVSESTQVTMDALIAA